MKKTLLLSVVASTMIMAGGDIAPVEPVVEAPVEVASWNFSGQAVAYLQTRDALGATQNGDLFGGATTATGLGLQLRATNDDIFAGIGFGAEVSTIQDGKSANVSSTHFGLQDGSALTQAYLTYGMDSISTSLKVGRQTLPKALSPFAFSETWGIFQNTLDAALVVNSSLPDTTLVYAFVTRTNNIVTALPTVAQNPWKQLQGSYNGLDDFDSINDDGVHMVTIQNKSITNLTLTGSWYIGPDHTAWTAEMAGLTGGGDTNILWGDAKYATDMFTLGVQGGQISPDSITGVPLDDTTAWGVMIAGNLGMFDLSAAYTSADDGSVRIVNLATDVKTPLYTQSILNQDVIGKDADTYKLSAGMKALGGKFGLSYINADLGPTALGAVMYSPANLKSSSQDILGNTQPDIAGTYEEIDFSYKTKVGENTTLFAAYVYQDDDRYENSDQNFVRLWAKYNF